MAWVDWVRRVARIRAIQGVVPFCSDLRAGRDGDDRLRDRLVVRVDPTVADNVVRGYVLNRLRVDQSVRYLSQRTRRLAPS